MLTKLLEYLNVRKEERAQVLLMLGAGFFMGTFLATYSVVAESLFLNTLGDLLNPRIDAVELLWQGDDALAETIPATERTSEGRLSRLPDLAAANAAAAAILQGGGTLLQLSPHRQSLEELFVHEAKNARRVP